MAFRIGLFAVGAALAAGACVAAEPKDRLDTPECKSARVALEQVLAREGAEKDEVAALKKRTAQACFGTVRNPSPNPGRVARPPVVVPPPATAARPALPPAAPPPPVAIQRPPAITSCDAGGCWDSNGTRLNRMGPGLSGPSGPCTAQGGFAYCP